MTDRHRQGQRWVNGVIRLLHDLRGEARDQRICRELGWRPGSDRGPGPTEASPDPPGPDRRRRQDWVVIMPLPSLTPEQRAAALEKAAAARKARAELRERLKSKGATVGDVLKQGE